MTIRIVDLFCGCGGFSLGFLQACSQFNISLAIDNDFRAIDTYTANIKVDKTLTKNIQNIHSNEILEQMNSFNPDIILASPPCEPFSVTNPRRKKTAYEQLYIDEKGRLVLDAIRLIIDLEPSIFVMENVTQLASIEMKDFIKHEFFRSKYDFIYFNILEATDFKVPSKRKRVFISNINLKKLNNEELITVGKAFNLLPEPSPEICNHENIPISSSISKKISRTPPGGALVYFKGGSSKTFRNYIRLEISKPSPTVMGKSRFIHPFEPRLCTVREHARLMSYPDSFQFFGPHTWQYNQVGESVPPQLSKMIAYQVLNNIREK